MTELEQLLVKKNMEQQRSKRTLKEYFHEFPWEQVQILLNSLDEETIYYNKKCWGINYNSDYIDPQPFYQRSLINDGLKTVLYGLYKAKRTSLEEVSKQISESYKKNKKPYGLCQILNLPIDQVEPIEVCLSREKSWQDKLTLSNVMTKVFGSNIYYSDQFTYDRLNELEKKQFDSHLAKIKLTHKNRDKYLEFSNAEVLISGNSTPIIGARKKYYEMDYFKNYTEIEKNAILGILKQKNQRLYSLCTYNQNFIENESFDQLDLLIKTLNDTYLDVIKKSLPLDENDKNWIYALSIAEWKQYFPENTSPLILPTISHLQSRSNNLSQESGLIPYTTRGVVQNAIKDRGIFMLNHEREYLLRNILAQEDKALATYYNEYITNGRILPNVSLFELRRLREWDNSFYQNQIPSRKHIDQIIKSAPVVIKDYQRYLSDFNHDSIYYQGCRKELEKYNQNRQHSCCGIESYCFSKEVELAKRKQYFR